MMNKQIIIGIYMVALLVLTGCGEDGYTRAINQREMCESKGMEYVETLFIPVDHFECIYETEVKKFVYPQDNNNVEVGDVFLTYDNISLIFKEDATNVKIECLDGTEVSIGEVSKGEEFTWEELGDRCEQYNRIYFFRDNTSINPAVYNISIEYESEEDSP